MHTDHSEDLVEDMENYPPPVCTICHEPLGRYHPQSEAGRQLCCHEHEVGEAIRRLRKFAEISVLAREALDPIPSTREERLLTASCIIEVIKQNISMDDVNWLLSDVGRLPAAPDNDLKAWPPDQPTDQEDLEAALRADPFALYDPDDDDPSK